MRDTSKEVPPISINIMSSTPSNFEKKIAPIVPAAGPDNRVAEACLIAVSQVIIPPLEAVT